jgi:hypothetical protein
LLKSILVLFSKKNSKVFFLKKEAKTFSPVRTRLAAGNNPPLAVTRDGR